MANEGMTTTYNLYLNTAGGASSERLRIDKITHNFVNFGHVQEVFRSFKVGGDRLRLVTEYADKYLSYTGSNYYKLTKEEYLRLLFFLKVNPNLVHRNVKMELLWDNAMAIDLKILEEHEEELINLSFKVYSEYKKFVVNFFIEHTPISMGL